MMLPSPEAVDTLLASLLRGEVTHFEELAAPDFEQPFLTAATEHGVDCLVRHLMKERGTWGAMPSNIRDSLDSRAHSETLVELTRRGELSRVLQGLGAANVSALVLKGAALAYTHYPAPYLRPCNDVDLLVSRNQRAVAASTIEALGYTRKDSVSREAVITQSAFELRRGPFRHFIDLHWAISNKPLFAAMLSFEELIGTAVAIPALGPGAATLAPVEALLFACIHRIAHHNDSHLLMWLFDLKLLAERLAVSEWERFVDLAIKKQLVSVSRDALTVTAGLLNGCEEGLQRFGSLEHSLETPEPSAAYLGGVRSLLSSLALDVKGSAGGAAKVRLLAGHAFPAPAYMRNKFGANSRIGLIRAYAYRAAVGTWRLVTSPMTRRRIVR